MNNVSTQAKFGFILATGKEGNGREGFKLVGSAGEEEISVSDATAQQKFEGEIVREISKIA